MCVCNANVLFTYAMRTEELTLVCESECDCDRWVIMLMNNNVRMIYKPRHKPTNMRRVRSRELTAEARIQFPIHTRENRKLYTHAWMKILNTNRDRIGCTVQLLQSNTQVHKHIQVESAKARDHQPDQPPLKSAHTSHLYMPTATDDAARWSSSVYGV